MISAYRWRERLTTPPGDTDVFDQWWASVEPTAQIYCPPSRQAALLDELAAGRQYVDGDSQYLLLDDQLYRLPYEAHGPNYDAWSMLIRTKKLSLTPSTRRTLTGWFELTEWVAAADGMFDDPEENIEVWEAIMLGETVEIGTDEYTFHYGQQRVIDVSRWLREMYCAAARASSLVPPRTRGPTIDLDDPEIAAEIDRQLGKWWWSSPDPRARRWLLIESRETSDPQLLLLEDVFCHRAMRLTPLEASEFAAVDDKPGLVKLVDRWQSVEHIYRWLALSAYPIETDLEARRLALRWNESSVRVDGFPYTVDLVAFQTALETPAFRRRIDAAIDAAPGSEEVIVDGWPISTAGWIRSSSTSGDNVDTEEKADDAVEPASIDERVWAAIRADPTATEVEIDHQTYSVENWWRTQLADRQAFKAAQKQRNARMPPADREFVFAAVQRGEMAIAPRSLTRDREVYVFCFGRLCTVVENQYTKTHLATLFESVANRASSWRPAVAAPVAAPPSRHARRRTSSAGSAPAGPSGATRHTPPISLGDWGRRRSVTTEA